MVSSKAYAAAAVAARRGVKSHENHFPSGRKCPPPFPFHLCGHQRDAQAVEAQELLITDTQLLFCYTREGIL